MTEDSTSTGPNVPDAQRLPLNQPAFLQIVATKVKKTGVLGFANGESNQYDSTLILRHKAQIPFRRPDQAEPQFVGHQLVLNGFPTNGERIVAIPVMDTDLAHAMRKLCAEAWTYKRFWDNASKTFKVIRWEAGNKTPVKEWLFAGIFELSYTFPSYEYDYRTGIIWSSSDGSVKYELIACNPDGSPERTTHPVYDPRVPLSMLPDDRRDRSLLANLSDL